MSIAPPAPSPARSEDPKRDGQELRLFGLVRDIRVESQNVGRTLVRIRTALALTDPVAQAAELARAVADTTRVLTDNAPVVDARFAALRDLVDLSPRVYDGAGDAITALENHWRELVHALSWPVKASPGEIAGRLDRADEHMRGIEWQAAIVTLPNRVRQHLRTKRVGGQLRFHDAFRDEMADQAQRVEMLRYLREHAASFNGVVDVPTGVIYRVSPKRWRRVSSWAALIILATLGAYGFVFVLTRGIPAIQLSFAGIAGIGPTRFPELMSAYWGLLVGSIAHVVVAAIKQGQRADANAFLALEDWFVWVHVRETALMVGILSLFAILIGLALVSTEPGTITPITAFGAGYSADSVLGLFITRFDTAAKTAGDATMAQMRGTATT